MQDQCLQSSKHICLCSGRRLADLCWDLLLYSSQWWLLWTRKGKRSIFLLPSSTWLMSPQPFQLRFQNQWLHHRSNVKQNWALLWNTWSNNPLGCVLELDLNLSLHLWASYSWFEAWLVCAMHTSRLKHFSRSKGLLFQVTSDLLLWRNLLHFHTPSFLVLWDPKPWSCCNKQHYSMA